MGRFWKLAIFILVGLPTLFVLSMIWALWPPSATHDQVKLRLIETESLVLMDGRTSKTVTDPKTGIESGIDIPEREWPSTIASLKPRFVIVFSDGLDIRLRSQFGDHWGYFVPLDSHKSPGPVSCISPLGQGVYWYDPC